jgi:ASC-1-like (ASCH) protein
MTAAEKSPAMSGGFSKIMQHKMKLNPESFGMISRKEKIFEIRLNDSKRKCINAGDNIRFTDGKNNKTLVALVKETKTAKDFIELFTITDPTLAGWSPGTTVKQAAADMARYYSSEDIQKFGVLAIAIEVTGDVSNSLRESIKRDLPNFPEEIIDEWLLSFAEYEGWPPYESKNPERWLRILTLDLHTWQRATWNKVNIKPFSIRWSTAAIKCLEDMQKCYLYNIDNAYSNLKKTGNGYRRFENALRYLLENGTFPKPIILKKEYEFGIFRGHSVMDGNHRLLALTVANAIHKELSGANQEQINEHATKLNIKNIIALKNTHDIWIADFNN